MTVTDERNIPVSTDSLPEGWTWRSASVAHHATILPNGIAEGSTTVTAVFDVDPGTLPDVADPGSTQPFRPTVVSAQWITDSTAYDPGATLTQLELAGPRVDIRGNLVPATGTRSGARRRGSYRAFRNEIALARGSGPAAESSQLTQAAVNALDGWAAHKGLPAVHVEIGDRA